MLATQPVRRVSPPISPSPCCRASADERNLFEKEIQGNSRPPARLVLAKNQSKSTVITQAHPALPAYNPFIILSDTIHKMGQSV